VSYCVVFTRREREGGERETDRQTDRQTDSRHADRREVHKEQEGRGKKRVRMGAQ
jgi:hypothetical protein